MNKTASAALLIAVLFAGAAALMVLAHSPPSTEDLDSDLSTVRHELEDSDRDVAVYQGGALKIFAELRREVLRSTVAMLVQKRESMLRRVDLRYVVDGAELAPADAGRLKAISGDLDAAKSKLDADKRNMQSSAGLLGVLSSMTVETDQLTVAQLELAYYGAKYGMALPSGLKSTQVSEPPKSAPGTIVKDKDAL